MSNISRTLAVVIPVLSVSFSSELFAPTPAVLASKAGTPAVVGGSTATAVAAVLDAQPVNIDGFNEKIAVAEEDLGGDSVPPEEEVHEKVVQEEEVQPTKVVQEEETPVGMDSVPFSDYA
jgi:hypothetical protein